MRYSDDRIAAVEFEGRKYRSNMLLHRAWAEADERKGAERVWKARPKLRTISVLMGYMFFGVGVIGGFALLNDPIVPRLPLWLSVLLLVVGAYGYFLSFRLDALAELHNLTTKTTKTLPAKSPADAYGAKIDAEWHAIISKPAIKPREAFMQYEEFLKNEEAKRKRQAFWGLDWGSLALLVALVGLFTFVIGYGLWNSREYGDGVDFWSLIWFGVHAAALVALLVYGFVKMFIIKPQADALLTPGPVPRGRSETTDWDVARRAAILNSFWRMGGAGNRVPFEATLCRNLDGPADRL